MRNRTSQEMFIDRWNDLLAEGCTDGHWKAYFDQDEFIPRRALEWLVGWRRWTDWRHDPGAFREPLAPPGHRYWFEIFHEAGGENLIASYPKEAKKGQPIEVILRGYIRNYERRIPWIHGKSGLVEFGLQDHIQEFVVRREARP